MTDEGPAPDDLAEVQRRLREIQDHKRGRVRWNVSKHTAELAIEAILPPRPPTRSGKARRRKKKKRLL